LIGSSGEVCVAVVLAFIKTAAKAGKGNIYAQKERTGPLLQSEEMGLGSRLKQAAALL
jgi:hypothetical protein